MWQPVTICFHFTLESFTVMRGNHRQLWHYVIYYVYQYSKNGYGKQQVFRTIFRLHHPKYVRRCGLLLPTKERGLSVCDTSDPCENGWTEMPFGSRAPVGPGNHVLDGCPDSSMVRSNFEGGKGHRIVKYRDTLRVSVQKWLNRFGLWASMGPNNHVLDRRPNPPWECAIFGERDAHSKV